MPRDPIQYFDRYDGKTKVEKIFGEPFLRLAYENPVGRFAVWLLFRRAFFSWYYGRKMSKPESAIPIIKFIGDCRDQRPGIREVLASDFKTFNEFFHGPRN